MGRQDHTGSSEVAHCSTAAQPRADRPRIALVGPVLPFRGGIAEHTTLLHRALAERAEVLALSFSRQYPAALFPGATDRHPDFAGHVEPGVRYEIDSLDPRTWRRAVEAVKHFGAQGLVLPWWSAYWSLCFHHVAAELRRARVPTVFICHNVLEHENAAWKRALSKWVLGTARGFVVHDRHARDRLAAMFPGAPIGVHPHPVATRLAPPHGTLPRRAALELLFFGFVRPYKGLDLLLDAMARLRDRDVMLTVAGEFWSGLEETRARISELGLHGKVEVLPRFHGEQESAELFARADAVVLPYRNATGSAVIPLAYGYGKPVVATDVGGLSDVVQEGRTGWLVRPEAGEIAGAIATMSAEAAASMRPAIQAYAATLTWDRFAEVVLETAMSR
jgi:glycosyltransferase involved in cell wall biosynthesis